VDVIGMAGGDGSQALVADVAHTHDVAFVCVPAGTRNHFALDLGLDREDVVAALDAFSEAVERRVDLAQVGDRIFVNNASMGVYATVCSPTRTATRSSRRRRRCCRISSDPRPSPSTCGSSAPTDGPRRQRTWCWCPTTSTTWRA
jgi:diacylglycerol kinase family enzyme